MTDLSTVKIFNLFFYQAAPGMVAIPRQVPPGSNELEVIVSGYGDFDVNGKAVRLGPGTTIWLCDEEWIRVTADHAAPYQTIVFVFNVPIESRYHGTFVFEWESPSSCRNFSQTALDNFTLKNFPDEHFGQCLYSRMIWEAECSRRRNALRDMPMSLDNAMKYIKAHYAEPITIADIAAAGGISVSHLHAVFQHHIGTSPFQYILKMRLNTACQLLSETTLSVKQVCDRCGFSDIKNFCSYFKRNHQLTPSAYRALTHGGRTS